MSANKSETTHIPKPKTSEPRTIDRKHWAARIGISFNALRNREFRRLFPFDPHLHNLKGYSYHYVDEGEGEPVVMVHGNPTWSFFYRRLIQGLRSQYRCLAPDHLGCGLSEKPQDYAYNLENHIINLETWLEEILPPLGWNGSQINLIVHDWGGPIGLSYAVRNPKRVKRIVIMNTSAFTSGEMPFSIRMCRWPVLGSLIVRGFNLFAGEATIRTTVKRMSRQVRKGFLLPYNSWKNLVGVYNFIQDIPLEPGRTRDILTTLDEGIADALKDKPILIQWGMKDWCFTPFFLDLWKQRFPNAEVDEYDAGHYLMEDAFGQILPRIQTFLRKACP